MSVFGDLVKSAGWPSLASQFGQVVTYTPYGGDAVSITAVWQPAEITDPYESDGQQQVEIGTLLASPADVSAPDTRDTVTISDTLYAVRRVARSVPIVELELERRTLREAGGAARIER